MHVKGHWSNCKRRLINDWFTTTTLVLCICHRAYLTYFGWLAQPLNMFQFDSHFQFVSSSIDGQQWWVLILTWKKIFCTTLIYIVFLPSLLLELHDWATWLAGWWLTILLIMIYILVIKTKYNSNQRLCKIWINFFILQKSHLQITNISRVSMLPWDSVDI